MEHQFVHLGSKKKRWVFIPTDHKYCNVDLTHIDSDRAIKDKEDLQFTLELKRKYLPEKPEVFFESFYFIMENYDRVISNLKREMLKEML